MVGVRRQLVHNNFYSTLNAAMRHVARQDSIPLVDLERLHLQLPTAHCYNSDGVHPLGVLLVSVYLNLVLNLYERDVGSSLLEAGERGCVDVTASARGVLPWSARHQ